MTRTLALPLLLCLPLAGLAALAGRLGLDDWRGYACLAGAGNGIVVVWLLQRRWLANDETAFQTALRRLSSEGLGAAGLEGGARLVAQFARTWLAARGVVAIVARPGGAFVWGVGRPPTMALDVVRLGRAAAVVSLDPASPSDAVSADVAELLAREACDRVVVLRKDDVAFGLIALETSRTDRAAARRLDQVQATFSFVIIVASLRESLRTAAQGLELAAPMQEAMMPAPKTNRHSGVELFGRFASAAYCGGDVWTWWELDRGKTLLFVGDATGHGLAAATLSATIKGVVEAHATARRGALALDELFENLHHWIRDLGRGHYFMSAMACLIDSGSRRLTVANAGHPFPFVLESAAGSPVRQVVEAGDLLGGQDALGQIGMKTLTLPPRALLMLHTDGLVDAEAGGRKYGNRQLRRVLESHLDASPEGLVEAVFADLRGFLGATELGDDVTVVAARLLE